jgi:putative transcriptional regulator
VIRYNIFVRLLRSFLTRSQERKQMGRRRKPTEWEIAMGQRIRELRLARDLTQEQLARMIDVGVDAVRKWERGKRTPMLDMAARLAAALECSIDDIAGYEKPKKRKEK